MIRGSERGTCTMARVAMRPKASVPASSTMKFRLLFWIRGNGRAGSGPRGAGTGSGALDDEVQTLVLEPRERPRRIEAQRREHRLDLIGEIRRNPLLLFGGPV